MNTSSPRMGSLKEAAALLNCSVATIRRRVHDGSLPHMRLTPGGAIRVNLDALPGITVAAPTRPRGEARSSASAASGRALEVGVSEVAAVLLSEVALAAHVLTPSHIAQIYRVMRSAWNEHNARTGSAG
ncbi:helix-turn-helix domain-containing protein [Nocardia asiatica]|uniref:helix-turn-helix domain-containing protein n=1 Tax=Nocardia asiatica TaxID=209252 RepID=UPI0024584FCD|nr:helix-turn-helix domain-containing protein [Nocardia asiatica]